MGEVLKLQGKIEDSKKTFLKALEIFENTKDDFGISKVLRKLARLSYDEKDKMDSLILAQRALSIAEKIKNFREIAKSSFLLSEIFLSFSHPKRAHIYANKAEDFFIKCNDNFNLDKLYNYKIFINQYDVKRKK